MKALCVHVHLLSVCLIINLFYLYLCSLYNQTRRGLRYSTTNVRSKKRIIREISDGLKRHNWPETELNILTVCKDIVKAKNEKQCNAYKYKEYYRKRSQYLKVPNGKYNLTGQGRKRSADRQQLYPLVKVIFEYYRYQMKMIIRSSDIEDYFCIAARFLNIEYDDSKASYDAKKWQEWANTKHYSVNSKLKYKSEYICAKVAQNQHMITRMMKTNSIDESMVISLDESMVFHDFCVGTNTISFKKRNDIVAWIPNDKDTTSCVCLWHWNKFECAALTTDGYKSQDGITVWRNNNIWWFRVPSKWMSEETYQFVLLFFMRVPYNQRVQSIEKAHFMFSDDKAAGHKSAYSWIKQLISIIGGVYAPICANVTAYVQVADDALCNGNFKRLIRRKGRDYMRKEIVKAMRNTNEHKALIPKVQTQQMDVLLSNVSIEMNSIQSIQNIRKAFIRKLNPKHYDQKLQEQLDLYDKIKDKYSESQLFPDKQNYYHNIQKKDTDFKDIADPLLNYKHPKRAYLCDCGWKYSIKNAKRIAKHNETCPKHSYYGVVPAYQPKDSSNNADWITEFIGYKQRIQNKKCMFRLEGRCLEFTDSNKNDILGKITRDMGSGYVVIQDTNSIKHVRELKSLRYHDTGRIWRNV
eukprot:739466_1